MKVGIIEVRSSHDSGTSWDNYEEILRDEVTVCQGSIIKCKDLLLFSAPKNYDRTDLTINISDDNGKTWKNKYSVYKGSCGYSNMVNIDDITMGILFERDCYNKIVFKTISVDELLNKNNYTNKISWFHADYI